MGNADASLLNKVNVMVAATEGGPTLAGGRRLSTEATFVDLSTLSDLSSIIVYDSTTHNIVLNDPPASFSESWTDKLFAIEVTGKCAAGDFQDYCLMTKET